MAQSLEVNIKATSEVPQAVEKSKAAVSGFSKQVDDIGKKFSNSFKDIFLGFLAPMVLIQMAMQAISSSIAKAKQDAKEAIDFAALGGGGKVSEGTAYQANVMQDRAKQIKEEEQAKLAREITTRDFIENASDEDKKRLYKGLGAGSSVYTQVMDSYSLSKNKETQMIVEAILNSKAMKQAELDKANGIGPAISNFTKPEGFSNVVGVGANPVIDVMNQQLAEARRTNEILERNNQAANVPVEQDFTKTPLFRRMDRGLK